MTTYRTDVSPATSTGDGVEAVMCLTDGEIQALQSRIGLIDKFSYTKICAADLAALLSEVRASRAPTSADMRMHNWVGDPDASGGEHCSRCGVGRIGTPDEGCTSIKRGIEDVLSARNTPTPDNAQQAVNRDAVIEAAMDVCAAVMRQRADLDAKADVSELVEAATSALSHMEHGSWCSHAPRVGKHECQCGVREATKKLKDALAAMRRLLTVDEEMVERASRKAHPAYWKIFDENPNGLMPDAIAKRAILRQRFLDEMRAALQVALGMLKGEHK